MKFAFELMFINLLDFKNICDKMNAVGVIILYLLEKDGLDLNTLTHLSYQSSLGISLKRSLQHFPKEMLFQEISDILMWYNKQNLNDIVADYRIKSYQSSVLKYERYYPNRPAEKVFNDLLGFRSLCDSYNSILDSSDFCGFRIVDMSDGKAADDGYRGVHAYFQIDHFHYPIEIQYNTYFDRQFNNWLHMFIYKKSYPTEVGSIMRKYYDDGAIHTEQEFGEVLKNVLSNS